MAHRLLAPIVVRPRRLVVLILPALVLSLSLGCSGRRQSMRPVYLTPAPAARPCPGGDCGGGSSVVVPESSSSPSATRIDPSVVESGTTSSGPAIEAPQSRPSATIDTPPPVTGPAVPGMSDEPGLEPAPPESSSKVAPVPKNSGSGGNVKPGSISPGASLKSTGNPRTSTGRVRQASLGDVRSFVDDPESLFQPPKADKPWKYVVLHHSASKTGGYDSIDREHRERLGWQGCGYHFVIGNGTESPDGKIEISQRWLNQKNGVHCRDGKNPEVNEYGIGICLVGDLEKAPPTPKQIEAARALVAYLSARYKIAPDHTETHAHLAASPTSCPGRLFPTQAILGTKGLAFR